MQAIARSNDPTPFCLSLTVARIIPITGSPVAVVSLSN